VLSAKKEGQQMDYVVASTVLIENPIAVVDTYAKARRGPLGTL
jgi:ABC-type sulfate transport system substrate-binding protein